MKSLEQYTLGINKFSKSSSSEKINLFAYYLTEILNNPSVSTRDIRECFVKLDMHPYSNISAYLSTHSKRGGYFVKAKSGYRLSATEKSRIAKLIGKPTLIEPTSALLPLESFENTRSYVEKIAIEINLCYDFGLFTACMVMLRRLFETLVIETYEKYKIEDSIQDSNGDYLMFSKLLTEYSSESIFKASRNLKGSLRKIKKMGDACAHNRKFIAKQSHIKPIREDIVLAVEEMLTTIDY